MLFYIHHLRYSSSTQPYEERKKKEKEKTHRPRRKGEEEAKTTDVNDFSQPRPLYT